VGDIRSAWSMALLRLRDSRYYRFAAARIIQDIYKPVMAVRMSAVQK